MSKNKFDEIYENALVKNGVKQISYEELMKIKKSGEDHVLMDVLTAESYDNGHIPGSVSSPVDEINKEKMQNLLSPVSRVIVYCASFECQASTDAARKLGNLGYKVLDYKGGLTEWRQKGNKLVRES